MCTEAHLTMRSHVEPQVGLTSRAVPPKEPTVKALFDKPSLTKEKEDFFTLKIWTHSPVKQQDLLGMKVHGI